MKKIGLVIALLFCIIFTSCCNCRISGSKQVTTLLNSKWQVNKLAGKEVNKVLDESFTLMFDVNRGAAYGIGSCNKYFSSYTLEGKNVVKFSSIGSTRMSCQDSVTETKYLEILKTVDGFIIDDSELMLLNKGNIVAILFKVVDGVEE